MVYPYLEQKCVHLDEKHKEFKKYRIRALISGSICGFALLSFIIVSPYQNVHLLPWGFNYFLLAIAAITFGVGIFYRIKGAPNKVKGNERIALYCYWSYKLLLKYQETKISSRLQEAKSHIYFALDKITSQWKTVEDDDQTFGKITEPLSVFIDNMKERFLPSINKEEFVEQNLKTFESLIPFLLDESIPDFNKINSMFASYPQIKKGELKFLKTERQKKIFRQIVYGVIFVGIGGVVTYISRLFGATDQTQIMVWVTVSVAAFIIYFGTFYKRSKT